MAANAEPLQGSLFGNAEEVSTTSKASFTNHPNKKVDFSEEELTKVPSQYQHLFSWKLDKYWGAM